MALSREQIFEGATGNQFIAIDKLPDSQGPLNRFKVLEIKITKGMSPDQLINALITALGEKPKYGGGEIRARQLSSLLKSATKNVGKLIFIIQSAHLLPPRTITIMKSLGEITEMAGFVFCGEMNKFKKKLEKIDGMNLRTEVISKA